MKEQIESVESEIKYILSNHLPSVYKIHKLLGELHAIIGCMQTWRITLDDLQKDSVSLNYN